jgi:hypothetical protein
VGTRHQQTGQHNRAVGVQRTAHRLLSSFSNHETVNIKIVRGTRLTLKEGDPRRRCHVLTPIGTGDEETIDNDVELSLPTPAKSVIAAAAEEHENQNDNQNGGHSLLHKLWLSGTSFS